MLIKCFVPGIWSLLTHYNDLYIMTDRNVDTYYG